MGLGNQVVNVTVISVRQVITPNQVLGRVNACAQFVTFGLAPLGALAGGVLGPMWACATPWWLRAAGTLTAFVWLFRSPVRGLRNPIPDSAVARPSRVS